MDAPLISILSAVGGTLTLALAIDPLFPAATTTVWVIDPLTQQPVQTLTAQVPPNVVIAGLSTTQDYVVVAQTFDALSNTRSPASMPVTVGPLSWASVLKTVIHANPVVGAREYQLLNKDTQAVLQTHEYHQFIDDQAFADEEAAQLFNYQVCAVLDAKTEDAPVVARYRTSKALCLVRGTMTDPGGAPYPWSMLFTYREIQRNPQDPPFIQNAVPIWHQIEVFPNYIGQWGAYLVQGARMEAKISSANRKRVEFIVPATSTADFHLLSLVPRPFLPPQTGYY